MSSRRKGSKAERTVAHLFTDWVGTEFVRVPRSGGLRWSSGLMVTGDVIPADPKVLAEFPFSIEVKFHAEVDFSHLLLPNKNVDIIKFWEQAKRDAKTIDKRPLVLFRYNFLPRDFYFIIIGLATFSELYSYFKFENGWFQYNGDDLRFVIMTSTDFFKIPYDKIKDLI